MAAEAPAQPARAEAAAAPASESDRILVLEPNPEKARELKERANELYLKGSADGALELYADALAMLPEEDKEGRAVVHANRAACFVTLKRFEDVIKESSAALALNPRYMKALKRRSRAYEETEKYAECLEDLKVIAEMDPGDVANHESIRRVSELHKQQQEKLKAEMLGKLKELGNGILGKFGLSLDNFKAVQDPQTGSYSISFQR